MPDPENKPDEKPVRTQFKHGATAQDILDGINKLQDELALEHPERAHLLYPDIWKEDGTRVIPRKRNN